jgi:hypothetical protein
MIQLLNISTTTLQFFSLKILKEQELEFETTLKEDFLQICNKSENDLVYNLQNEYPTIKYDILKALLETNTTTTEPKQEINDEVSLLLQSNNNFKDLQPTLKENNLIIKLDYSQYKETNKYLQAKEKYVDYRTKIISLEQEIIHRVKNETSKTKKCSHCNSIIAKEYLENISCPVCKSKDYLITETDSRRFASYQNYLEKNKEAFLESISLDKENEEYTYYFFINFNILLLPTLLEKYQNI